MSKNVKLTAGAVRSALPRGIFVHASADDTVLEGENAAAEIAAEVTQMEAYVCASCDTHLTAAADSSPFCVNCGSTTVKDSAPAAVKAKVNASTIFASVGCPGCGTNITLQASALHACGNSIHCSVCGEHMDVSLTAAADEYVMPEGVTAADNVDDKLPEVKPEPAVAELPAVEPIEETPVAATEEIPVVAAEEPTDELAIVEEKPLEAGMDSSEEADVIPTEGDQPILAADGMQVGAEDLLPMPGEEVTASTDASKMAPITKHEDCEGVADDRGSVLANALNVDDTANDLSFVEVQGRLAALKAHVTVYSLQASDAGDNADLMFQSNFISAVRRNIQSKGLRAGLEDFGFRPVRVPTVTQETVKASITAATQKVEEKHLKAAANLEESLAIAATGLNRGKFRNFTNPLRAALEAELQAVGVRNAGRVVANVFDRYGVEYTSNLLRAANKVSQLSAEARQDMKEMLNMTREVSAGMEEDNMQEDTALVARLQAAPINTVGNTQKVAPSRVSASVNDRVNAIIAGDAPLTFNF